MINPDDDLPKAVRALLVPPVLDQMGVEELKLYITLLKSEISRVESAISGKQAHRAAASAFFKPPAA